MMGALMISMLLAQSSRYPVRDTETIRRTLEFSGSANRMIELDNLSGSIHVVAAAGNAVEMTANKTIRAESQDRVQDAKRDVKLEITDKAVVS